MPANKGVMPPLIPWLQIRHFRAGPGRLGPASAASADGMDFGVGALILMVVIMIGPPKSEKLKAPHRGDATAAGKRTGSRCGGRPPVRGSCGPPIPPGIRVPGNGAPIPPGHGCGRPCLGPRPCWCGGPAYCPASGARSE